MIKRRQCSFFNIISSFFFFSGIGEDVSALLIPEPSFEFTIKTEWDGTPYTKESPVKVKMDGVGEFVRIQVDAPLYNDTSPPKGQKGLPYPNLFNYEGMYSSDTRYPVMRKLTTAITFCKSSSPTISIHWVFYKLALDKNTFIETKLLH